MSKYACIIRLLNKEIIMKNNIIIKISHQKQRITWGFSPVTRVKPSKKHYSRKNYKVEL